MALVLTAVFPVIAGTAMLLSKILAGGSSKEQDAYAAAGGIAQEAISSMRTVVAFGGEEKEAERYSNRLALAEKAGIKKALFNGIGVGMLQLCIFLVYALAFWYGNTLIPQTMNAGGVSAFIFKNDLIYFA